MRSLQKVVQVKSTMKHIARHQETSSVIALTLKVCKLPPSRLSTVETTEEDVFVCTALIACRGSAVHVAAQLLLIRNVLGEGERDMDNC